MTLRIAILLCATSGLTLADTWSGVLVDAGCFAREEQNVTKDYGPAERDMRLSIDPCTPSAKTRSFAIVLPDGSALRFDASGNARAAEMVKAAGVKHHPMRVAVGGDAKKDTISVTSLSAEARLGS